MSLPSHRRSAALSRSLVCALTALAVGTASCSSMHQVPVVQTPAAQPPVWQVMAGDTIRITLRDGGFAEFKVQSVTSDTIIASDGRRFEHANITSVRRRQFSLGKTLGLGVGLGGIALYILALSFFQGHWITGR